MFKSVKLFEFKEFGDERGKLTVIEGMRDIPFKIERIFYIYDSDNSIIRGKHANRESEFILVNICGSSKVRVTDGFQEKIYTLDRPNLGLYIPKLIWKDMYDFSTNSILICLASEKYNPNEYIRNYDEYLQEMKKIKC